MESLQIKQELDDSVIDILNKVTKNGNNIMYSPSLLHDETMVLLHRAT